MSTNNKVILGLSGGVDSTAAALLLQEAGYEVTGLYFSVGPEAESSPGRERAEKAAAALRIPLLCKDVSALFEERIIEYFCREYLAGRTPSPCVKCNPEVKFRTLLKAAEEAGAGFIATGHYARVEYDSSVGIWFPARGANQKKDQSYMLYRLPQGVLARLLLPLGEIGDKETVRALAREKAVPNAEDRDSQEICFIPEGDYASYLLGRGCASPEGDFVDADGAVLGRHKGLLHYTVGQRKGLGNTFGRPMFVSALDPVKNTVTLGEDAALYRKTVMADNCFFPGWTGELSPGLPEVYRGAEVMGKIRYGAAPAAARLYPEGEGALRAEFDEPQRAPTPGQSLVFYQGDRVIGGGIIINSN